MAEPASETSPEDMRTADQRTLAMFYDWLGQEMAKGHIWWLPVRLMVGVQVAAMMRGAQKAKESQK